MKLDLSRAKCKDNSKFPAEWSCSRVLSNTPFLPPGFSDEHSQGYITIEIPGKREAVITKVRVVQLANLKEKTARESKDLFSRRVGQ